MGDGTVSRQSCHLPRAGGADTRRYPVSAFGKIRQVNSPSIYNLHFNTSGLNWTGRTASLERQIDHQRTSDPARFLHHDAPTHV